MTLIELVAEQLKVAANQNEFDKIFKYHFKNDSDGKYRKQMEELGVNFDRFKQPIIEEPTIETTTDPDVDVAALTKMIIDKPIVKKKKGSK